MIIGSTWVLTVTCDGPHHTGRPRNVHHYGHSKRDAMAMFNRTGWRWLEGEDAAHPQCLCPVCVRRENKKPVSYRSHDR